VYAECDVATVVFAMLGKAFISFAYSVVYVYASEIFPTEIRNVGVGTAAMCGRVSSMAASYVGGPLVNKPSVSAFSSYCVNVNQSWPIYSITERGFRS